MRTPLLLLVLALVGCAPQPPTQSALRAVTPVPTLDRTDQTALCQIAQTADDMLLRIEALEALNAAGTACAGLNVPEALYMAYVRHADQLAANGRADAARRAYQTSLDYTETDSRARDALGMTTSATDAPPEACPDNIVTPDAVPAYTPSSGAAFVSLVDGRLVLDTRPFVVRGVIYEPRDTPGRHFLAQTSREAIAQELDLIAGTGLNTLRLYLHHAVLFTCSEAGAAPVLTAFERLDAVLSEATARNLRVVMVLHHGDAPYAQRHTAQTTYLVRRYAEEPAVLAWDVRDGGDIDYTERDVERDAVLAWLTEITRLVRQAAPRHLVTAGWHHDAAVTAPLVDFVSFQHYGSVDDLRQRIALLQTQTAKPLLLAGVGYPTVDGDELGQRDQLYGALRAAENNSLLGWVVFAAFDHPGTVCEGCRRYGLWNTSYFPKLALDAPQTIIDGSR